MRVKRVLGSFQRFVNAERINDSESTIEALGLEIQAKLAKDAREISLILKSPNFTNIGITNIIRKYGPQILTEKTQKIDAHVRELALLGVEIEPFTPVYPDGHEKAGEEPTYNDLLDHELGNL